MLRVFGSLMKDTGKLYPNKLSVSTGSFTNVFCQILNLPQHEKVSSVICAWNHLKQCHQNNIITSHTFQ